MKAWALSISMICISSNGLATDSISIGYDELHDIISKNNSGLHASLESVNAARQRVGIIGRTFLPKAAFEAGISEKKEANGIGDTAPFWKIDVQANLYRGGRDKVDLLLRDSQILIKEMDARAFYRSELFKAKTEYVQLSAIRQLKALTKDSVQEYTSLQKSIARKTQAGLMTNAAAQNSEFEVDDLKRRFIELESEEHELEDKLLLVLGLKADSSIILKSTFSTISQPQDSQFGASQIEELPEIKKLTIFSESSLIEARSKKEWWLPDVNVFASYTTFNIESRNEFSSLPEREMTFGVRISIDLESKNALDSEISAKKSEIRAIQLQKDHLSREIGHKLHEYQREMDTQGRLMKAYETGIAKSGKLLKQLQDEFERGIVSSEDITSSLRSIYQMKNKRVQSEADFLLAKAGLEVMADLLKK